MDTTTLLYTLLTIAGIIGFLQVTAGMQVWLERKLSAWLQDRHGPNRVGPFGLLQSLADGLKFILKEELLPGNVDKTLYLLAPCIGLTTATLAFAVVPFGDTSVPSLGHNPGYQFVVAPNIDIGFLFIFAASSITVYAVILAGWAANNKYSFIGGLRSSAQIVSYEIPMGMSIIGIVLVSGSLNLERIIERQVNPEHSAWWLWNVVQQPLPFLIFMIACFAECNRMPFDLPECEQELVGGYHTEYGAMKLAMLLMGEYTHMVTTSFLMAILFFGGWHFPWIAEVNSPWFMKVFVFAVKMGAFIMFYMLVRWTILRFRFDQLMGLAWKVLIPMTMVYLLCVMVVVELDKQWGWTGSTWLLLPISLLILVGAAWLALLMPKGKNARSFGPRLNRGDVMPIDAKDVRWVQAPKIGLAEKLYLPAILQGLQTTMRHMFEPRVTQQYPEVQPDLPANYRGVHRLNRDEQGRVKCVACYMCSTACPAHCIDIVAAPSPWPDREKYPETFVIDELRCIYCGMCEQACPCDAVELTSLFDLTGLSREEMMFDKEKLLSVFDETVKMGKDPIRTRSGPLSIASEPSA